MSRKLLIGITGHIGSGKTTAGKYLVSRYNFVERSFADPLKDACKTLFLFSDEQVRGTQDQKASPDPRWFNCSPRIALQFIGTDLLRNRLDEIMPGLGQDIFIRHFALWYANTSCSVVLHDVRFKNEAIALKNLGGTIIRIKRDEVDVVEHTHTSEMEIDEIEPDYCIENNGGVNDLFRKIDRIVSCIE